MQTTPISTRIDVETKKALKTEAKSKGLTVSLLVSRILVDHVLNPTIQKNDSYKGNVARVGVSLDCPIMPRPLNPKWSWVDVSVCENCTKKLSHDAPCPAWEDYQSQKRVETLNKKPIKKRRRY